MKWRSLDLLSGVCGVSSVALVWLVPLFGGCSGSRSEPRPVASLAITADATVAFEEIRVAWEAHESRRPLVLRPMLERFLGRYPRDGRIPMARAMTAIVAMEEENWVAARALVTGLAGTPPGTTDNLVTIGRARLLRYDKQPDQAFALMRPLVGKTVDATVRELFLEEITRDALEAHRDYEAIAYMDAWVRGVSEDQREAVRDKVVKILEALRDDVLEGTYRAMRANSSVGYGTEIQRLVAERLAATAIARGDPTLARWLLDSDAGPTFVGNESTVALGEIATSRRGLITVVGRTIGLLLPTGSADLRDESADVVRGVSWALDLPRTSTGDAVKLVTRDDAGDPTRTDAALEELAGEGCSIIVGGLDSGSSDRLLRWGEAHAMPVIALAVPLEKPGTFGYVIGEPIENELSALSEALASRSISKIALVASPSALSLPPPARAGITFFPGVSCDLEASRAGDPRFPVVSWTHDGAHGWIVAGPVECARDVIRELGARAHSVGVVGLTLEGTGTSARAPSLRIVSTAAGVIPLLPRAAAQDLPDDVRAYTAQFAARPSWWTALGRDAGSLARRAIIALPTDTSADAAEIARRRALLNAGLPQIKSLLWTSEADGLAPDHTVKRVLRVVELAR